ncbi:T9SS type A sorting domain-containing protein [Pedobacter sp. BS3]|uniref:T9SS type A sorting domain-containing protein n=1 Tax=Pedobacter sp. BS3 TaxID=2567937 RepID=UPI0011EE79D8|nr:T9SS type A sorting domain-containing protein [Pedobacter sp. BS3]TZF81685.1 T9SS type A sorting domain-containing protein [Pedobacter sp. BS3]
MSGDIGTANNVTDNSYHIMAIAYDENSSVHNPIDNSTVIDGFEFTSGNANSGSVTNDGLYPRFSGSAVFITSWGEEVNITPTISNCTFINNRAFQSGAIYCDAAATSSNRLKISGCRFENNYAEYEGAAINLFNLADAGYEGVSGSYSAEISGCTFVNNSVNNASQGGVNGGMGAAIMAFGQGSTTITGCVFDNNQSTNYGSAIALRKNATVSVNNSLFYTTENGAFVLVYNNQSNLQLLNSTLYSQYGGVLQVDGTTAFDLSNSILWTDASGTNVVTAADANGEVTNCLINSTYSAPNMFTTNVINQNPLFADISSDNYTLQAGSPAINAGNNGLYAGLDASTTDLAGNPRVYNYASAGVIDIGAYEYQDDTPLPVSLLTFTAKADGNRALLQWQTASEQNNRKFIVYRSGDDGKFIRIGEKEGAGTTTITSNYIFYDAAPLYGNNYYKLVQVDLDGKTTELGVKLLTYNLQRITYNIFPNPTTGSIHANFEKGKYNNVILTDMTGRILTEQAMDHEAQSAAFNLSGYPAGNYFLMFVGNGVKVTEKVIKK